MEKRQLGKSDLFVSPLAFGGNVLGWTINETQSFGVLDAFLASGCNFIDTADVYARWATGIGGESEMILGKWMRQRQNRKQIILATKVGMDMGDHKKGLSKKYILKAVEASLKRLQTDYIDLYQSHKDDEFTPIEETLDAYQQLIKEGKIRFIGASNFTPDRLQESLDKSRQFSLPRYECLQPHYNLLERKAFEEGLEKMCLESKVAVINYFPLASGFLTGKYRHENDFGKSIRGGSMAKFLNDKGLKILKALDEISDNHKTKPASVTLAWYMTRPSIIAPIASATSVLQLNDLVNATHLKLTSQEIEYLDSCSMY